jgi:hypothetical protein
MLTPFMQPSSAGIPLATSPFAPMAGASAILVLAMLVLAAVLVLAAGRDRDA